MDSKKLDKIISAHNLWLMSQGGVKANLSDANLRGANLRSANLSGANLSDANLSDANLSDADLRGSDLGSTNLSSANFRGANLRGADLRCADLRGADLRGANFRGANLRGADLRGADLRGADLRGANLPYFQICPQEGDFIAWKMTLGGVVKLLITGERTSSLISRKCRCSECRVIEGSGFDKYSRTINYKKGEIIKPNSYNPDIRIECAHGIHFFMTREEAERY